MRVVSDIHASVCSMDTWISSAPIILMGGRCEQPSVGRVGANPISLSAQCGKGFLERGRPRFLSADPQDVGTVSAEHGSSAPVIPVMPHVAVCASTASMSARIRHEWPDRLWTVRILRSRKGGIRTCFRSPTGRGDSPRNCPVRVRTPAKAPAEATASTPPDPVRTSDGTGTMLR